MGWLGWTDREAFRADVNSVILALDAKADLLSICYGDGKRKSKGKRSKGKVTSSSFKAFRDRHNRVAARGE